MRASSASRPCVLPQLAASSSSLCFVTLLSMLMLCGSPLFPSRRCRVRGSVSCGDCSGAPSRSDPPSPRRPPRSHARQSSRPAPGFVSIDHVCARAALDTHSALPLPPPASSTLSTLARGAVACGPEAHSGKSRGWHSSDCWSAHCVKEGLGFCTHSCATESERRAAPARRRLTGGHDEG